MSLIGIGIGVCFPESRVAHVPPTTGRATYNYTTPVTGTAPISGELQHPDNFVGRFSINKIDAMGGSHDFEYLTTGNTLTINAQIYTITAPATDYGTYASVPITPTVQQVDTIYEVTLNIA